MDTNIVAHDAYLAQYAEGVLIRLTGGTVYDFMPWPKVDGYLDAGSMTAQEAAPWLALCASKGYYLAEVRQ